MIINETNLEVVDNSGARRVRALGYWWFQKKICKCR